MICLSLRGSPTNDPDMELANAVTKTVIEDIEKEIAAVERSFEKVKGELPLNIKNLLIGRMKDAIYGIKNNSSSIHFPSWFRVETAIMGNIPSGKLIILSSAIDGQDKEAEPESERKD